MRFAVGGFRKRLADRLCGRWPHDTRDLLAVFEKNQRGPEFHLEGAPEGAPLAILDFEMPDVRRLRERGGDERLRRLTMRAPRRAELEQRRTFQRVDFGACGF